MPSNRSDRKRPGRKILQARSRQTGAAGMQHRGSPKRRSEGRGHGRAAEDALELMHQPLSPQEEQEDGDINRLYV